MLPTSQTLKSPLDWAGYRSRGFAFAVLSALFVITSLWLFYASMPLNTDVAPLGILDFELARRASRSAEIMQSWSSAAREAAAFTIGFDFLYMIVYSLWLSMALVYAVERSDRKWYREGIILSWMVLACIALDGTENVALLHQLKHGASETGAFVAWSFASVKFLILAVVIVFIPLCTFRPRLSRP